ncbi:MULTISPECIES: chemotaxis protein CheW [Sphingomonas]|uniref:Purine-binding chemotaxis protein CheW n=1 Tax=Sphingomonas kyeonggiensis TaxID=1268553 RepID=A0A7W7NTU5_9SPHN|nr:MULTISPECIES: chemotaxis protein CheW [Sphingomonas]MBB4840109.1 purine-binding chemotaxis protein CheW [Sphingomonas kyeonggiensis]WHU04741.1 chemotaxis protein CheW [Sphingomonas sp. NIBR02145]
MTTTNDNAGTDRKIVTFSLAQQTFGIDMRALIEIREWDEPTPLPNVPGFIKGVTNLRGNVIPVVGLAERLGWEPSVIHARSCVLVVNIAGKQAGFLVDEVNDIVAIGETEIQPAPEVETIEPTVIAGLVRIATRQKDGTRDEKGTMVLLLDLDALSLTKHLDLAA